MTKGIYDSVQEHFVGEEDVLTGFHGDWLGDETITQVTAVSSNPSKVEVDSPGTTNGNTITILGRTATAGQASMVPYRVVSGTAGDKVVITVTIVTTDGNRTDLGKHLIQIMG